MRNVATGRGRSEEEGMQQTVSLPGRRRTKSRSRVAGDVVVEGFCQSRSV